MSRFLETPEEIDRRNQARAELTAINEASSVQQRSPSRGVRRPQRTNAPPGGANSPIVTKRRQVSFDEWLENLRNGDKYKPNAESEEIIGVQQTPYSIIVLDDPSAALTETTFDSTSFSEGIEFLYTNSTGSSVNLRGHVIRGKLVTRLSGEEGFLNDEFIDFEDIYENGENVLEIGNNMIVTRSQVDQLAEYHAKWNFEGRHTYSVVMTGAQDWFEIGEWYTLDIAGPASKFEENIDSVVECIGVEIDAPVDRISTTVITFQEVYQNFQPTWNVAGKFYSIGAVQRTFARGGVVRVSSSTDADTADYYCDGTDDNKQIQAAIDLLSASGGGTVILSPGTFTISTYITLADNVTVTGDGIGQTIIERNASTNVPALTATNLSGGQLFDLTVKRNSSDSQTSDLIKLNSSGGTGADSLRFERIAVRDSKGAGISIARVADSVFKDVVVSGTTTVTGLSISNATNCIITGCFIDDCSFRGIDVSSTSSAITITDCVVDSLSEGSGAVTAVGIYLDADNSTIAGCKITNASISGSASGFFGVYCLGDNSAITNTIVENCSTVAQQYSIYIIGNDTSLNGCIVKNCDADTNIYGISASLATPMSGCKVKTLSNSGTGVTIGISIPTNGNATSCIVDGVTTTNASNSNTIRGYNIGQDASISGSAALNITTSGTGSAHGFGSFFPYSTVSSCSATSCDDSGFYVSGDDCTISGCTARNNDYGIEISANADRTVITGNRLTSNTTANLQDNGTNTTTTGNDTT
jgi:parallel beta-helix repeat protein